MRRSARVCCLAWPAVVVVDVGAGWLACELPIRARDAVHPHTELVVRLMVTLGTVATVATAAVDTV